MQATTCVVQCASWPRARPARRGSRWGCSVVGEPSSKPVCCAPLQSCLKHELETVIVRTHVCTCAPVTRYSPAAESSARPISGAPSLLRNSMLQILQKCHCSYRMSPVAVRLTPHVHPVPFYTGCTSAKAVNARCLLCAAQRKIQVRHSIVAPTCCLHHTQAPERPAS